MNKRIVLCGIILGCFACNTIPAGIEAVHPFEKSRYLGRWYEIARLDFKFERDLMNTTADYSLNDDGTIKVLNQGYNTKTNKWVEATGKAKFVSKDTLAMLKVSFFGPFYAGYNVIEIDTAYNYALVAGQNLEYLWILSRHTAIPEDIQLKYLKIAQNLGFDTAGLIWVKHYTVQ